MVFEGVCKMAGKWTIFTLLVGFSALLVNPVAVAVNTAQIDTVRNEDVLDSGDLQIIDKFVADAVRELAKTRDFTSIARIRTVILSRNSSNKDSAQAQYVEQFSESAYKYISLGFEQAELLTPQERKAKVILNLLILIDGLEDLRLADLAIAQLKDENMAIRYWAVHSVTNRGITKQLNSTKVADLQLAHRIVEQLKALVDSSSPEIVALMAKFAAAVSVPQGEELLLQIADMRIKRYADWTVKYELLDGAILKLLFKNISSAGLSKPLPAAGTGSAAVARRFGQLYSYAILRYVDGQDFLGTAEKHQLASVLVETEKSSIGKLLGKQQTTIRRAVEQDDYTGLLLEHSRLLGDETRAGKLSLKLKFDYGANPDGHKRTAPLTLSKPPKN